VAPFFNGNQQSVVTTTDGATLQLSTKNCISPHGYTMKAIADHPGIHYTTVSKVIKARKITDISRPDPIYAPIYDPIYV